MTEAEIAAIRDRAATRTHRLAVVESAHGDVVVKGQRRSRSIWVASFANLLARAVGLPLLQAIPTRGGSAAQAVEVKRLHSLHDAGVAVPKVLHVDKSFIVMQRLFGTNLVELIEQGGVEAEAWWWRGMQALVEVHRRGQYLSQAFARNFIATDAGLAMIDFEEDPRDVLSLAEAQARDWLAYLHSTAWHLRIDEASARAMLAAQLAQERDDVRTLVKHAGQRLAWLRHLPRSRRPWGREVVGLQALASLFHANAAAVERRA